MQCERRPRKLPHESRSARRFLRARELRQHCIDDRALALEKLLGSWEYPGESLVRLSLQQHDGGLAPSRIGEQLFGRNDTGRIEDDGRREVLLEPAMRKGERCVNRSAFDACELDELQRVEHRLCIASVSALSHRRRECYPCGTEAERRMRGHAERGLLGRFAKLLRADTEALKKIPFFVVLEPRRDVSLEHDVHVVGEWMAVSHVLTEETEEHRIAGCESDLGACDLEAANQMFSKVHRKVRLVDQLAAVLVGEREDPEARPSPTAGTRE